MTSSSRTQILRDLCWNSASIEPEFTYYTLSEKVKRSVAQIIYVVRVWEAEGRIERLGATGSKGRLRFRLIDPETKRPLVVPRKLGREGESVHGNMWTAMRGLTTFTPRDIAAHAATELIHVSLDAAQEYCSILVRSKHLVVREKAIPGRRDAVYRLILNTGPLPPRQKRVSAIWDPNRTEYMHVAGGDE